MLIDLYVNNFAIIEDLNLEFDSNLTVISGETGAGKSLTVDALSLVLGGKGDASMIYQGKDQGEVIATFDITEIPKAQQWIEDNSIENTENLCILRRVLTQNGRTRGFINGRAMPLHALKSLGETLVDIHGQHAHQSLTKASAQRQLVDQYAEAEQDVQSLTELTRHLQNLEQKLADLKNRDESAQERINFLKFQLAEFTTIAPQKGEWEEISQRFDYLSNYEERLSNVQTCVTLLNDDDHGITRKLTQLQQAVETLKKNDESFSDLMEMVNSAVILCSESENELSYHLDLDNFDPHELQSIENRMKELNSLARKHRIDPENLLIKQADLEKELASQDVSEEALLELEAEIHKLKETWQYKADEITKKRLSAASEMNEKITESMQSLAMEGGKFSVNFTPNTPFHPYGNEAIDFLVSANPGQPLFPLGKVASGGELARISLSISVILSMRSSLPTLIFDEVDTGVGGAVAEIIGKHLQNLSSGRQVFCVTHLPQVASFGHHHFKVYKEKGKTSTQTSIQKLDKKQRIDEIARMLGGVKLTVATYEHAKEMLKNNT